MAGKVASQKQPGGAQFLGQLKQATSAEGQEVRKSTEDQVRQYDDVRSKGSKAVSATEKQTGKSLSEMQLEAVQKGNQNLDRINQAQIQKEAAVQEGGDIAGANLNGSGGSADERVIGQFQQRFAQNFAGGDRSMIRQPESRSSGSDQAGGPGAGFARKGGGPAAANTTDLGQLKQALAAKRTENADIQGQEGDLSGRQQGIVQKGARFAQSGQRFGALKAGNKADMLSQGALKQAYGDTGKGLKSAAQGMGQASQAMQGVTQALQSAAAAVAAIPFVGPALSKALTTAAQVVSMVSKALKAGAQRTNASGNKMNQKSNLEKTKEQQSKAKMVSNGLKETQAKDQAKRANQNAKTVDGHKNQATDAREANVREQQEIARKIADNGGGKVTIDQNAGHDRNAEQTRTANPTRTPATQNTKSTAPRTAPATQSSQPTAPQVTQPAATQATQPTAAQATQPTATQTTQPTAPQATEASQPAATQTIHAVQPAALQSTGTSAPQAIQPVAAQATQPAADAKPGVPAPQPKGRPVSLRKRAQNQQRNQQPQTRSTSGGGQTTLGGGPSKHELALREAADGVLNHQGGGHALQAKLQKLDNLRKDTKDTAVSREVAGRVDEAYKKAAVRPTGPKLKIAEESQESVARPSSGPARDKQTQDNRPKLSLNLPKLVIPKMPPPPQFQLNLQTDEERGSQKRAS